MDDKQTSLINQHRTTKRTWPKNSPIKIVCDSIHRYSNPTKNCDDHVLKYIVDTFDNGTHEVVCIADIFDTHYLFAISGNHSHRNLIQKNSVEIQKKNMINRCAKHRNQDKSFITINLHRVCCPSDHFHRPLHRPSVDVFDPYLWQGLRHLFPVQRNFLRPFVLSNEKQTI